MKEAMQIRCETLSYQAYEITEEKLDEVLSRFSSIWISGRIIRKRSGMTGWNLWGKRCGVQRFRKREKQIFSGDVYLARLAVLPGDTREAYLSKKEIWGLENEDLSILAFSKAEVHLWPLFTL